MKWHMIQQGQRKWIKDLKTQACIIPRRIYWEDFVIDIVGDFLAIILKVQAYKSKNRQMEFHQGKK